MGVVEQLSAKSGDQSLERARALVEAADLRGAWRFYTEAVAGNPGSEQLLTAAADLWVTAVDRGEIGDWPDDERRTLEEAGCLTGPVVPRAA